MDPEVSSEVAALVAAWRRWDQRPADEARARSFEQACRPLAARAGVPVSTFRDRLSAGRRAQMPLATAAVQAMKGPISVHVWPGCEA